MKITLKPYKDDYENVPDDVFAKVKRFGDKITWIMSALGFGILFPEVEKVSCDYSKYLGKGYEKPERFNTIVSNHQSYFDIFYLLQYCFPSFVSKAEISKIPLFGYFTTALRGIYLN